MFASQLRQIAQGISDQAGQALADALGWEQRVVRMEEDGTYGARDLAYAHAEAEAADRRALDLCEQEIHAWSAYEDASQAEFFDYLAEND